MCGIVGCWHLDGQPLEPGALGRFTDTVAHRGPDGHGTWIDESAALGLGHRRLAILDLSDEGRQPMSFGDSRWWIVFNGEIFNFLELRQELIEKGHRFRSTSDTEVILASWATWGPDALERFNGMWAFALWDRRERRLILSRDRFGVKPLLYLHEPGRRFAFASEQRAFRALRGFVPTIDPDSARAVLLDPFGLEGSERGSWSGVRRLPGGHWLEVTASGAVTVRRWWRTTDHLPNVPTTLEAQAIRFQELFSDAVRIRMRSDVAIGTCLSGGFDSSAVLCTLGAMGRSAANIGERQAPEWHRAFVATFPGASNDERPFAEEAIGWMGAEGTFLPITEGDALRDIEPTLEALEEVYQSLLTGVWRIYGEVRRRGVVVTLDGHGADELMGGYLGEDQLALRDARPWWSHPAANVRLLRRRLALMDDAMRPRGWNALSTAVRLTLGHHPDFRRIRPVLRRWRGRFAPVAMGGRSAFVRGRPAPLPDLVVPAAADVLPAEWGEVNRSLYRMFHVDLLPTILRNFDRLSSAHGVEVRMPFMDWRVATYVMALPDSSKVGDGVSKLVAREAMRGRMPESIRTARRKVGFHSPLPEWLGGPLVPWTETLLGEAPADHPVINVPVLRDWVAARRKAGWNWWNAQLVWPFLHHLWCERALRDSAPIPTHPARPPSETFDVSMANTGDGSIGRR